MQEKNLAAVLLSLDEGTHAWSPAQRNRVGAFDVIQVCLPQCICAHERIL
jgi:hypothetical protein